MKQIFIIGVSVLFFNLTLMSTAFALNEKNTVHDENAYPVEIRSTPEKDIAGMAKDQNKGFVSKYKWWILGGIAVIGSAAIVAGSGSSGSGGGNIDDTPQGPDTGSATISW